MRKSLLSKLEARGFDRCKLTSLPGERASAHVGCSQCEALVINGLACHETGCPNEEVAKRREREERE